MVPHFRSLRDFGISFDQKSRHRPKDTARLTSTDSVEPIPIISETEWAARLADEHFQPRPLSIFEDQPKGAFLPNIASTMYNKTRPMMTPSLQRLKNEGSPSTRSSEQPGPFGSKATCRSRNGSLSVLCNKSRGRARSFVDKLSIGKYTRKARISSELPCQDRFSSTSEIFSRNVSNCVESFPNPTSVSVPHTQEYGRSADIELCPTSNSPQQIASRENVDSEAILSQHSPSIATISSTTSTKTPPSSPQDTASTVASSPSRVCFHERYTYMECQCSVTRVVYCSCPVRGGCLQTSLENRNGLSVLTDMKYLLNPICHDCLMREIHKGDKAEKSKDGPVS